MNSGPQTRIQLLLPDMPAADEILPYLRKIDAARWYTNFGPLNAELEARLGGLCPSAGVAEPAVHTVANATLAIELALRVLGLPAGSRILLPALTFSATAAAVVRTGHVPVASDVDANSWLLTTSIAREAAQALAIAGVIPVCTYGCNQDIEAWDRFHQDTGIPVVIDAAGAFGNQHAAERACVVFSLHATKSLGAGEGGFVISGDADQMREIKRLSNFGIDVSTSYVPSAGTNAKLSEYHAAVALAALDAWPRRRARRVDLHRQYLAALAAHCPTVHLQHRPADGVYTILSVLLPEGVSARDVAACLAQQHVETRRWYWPTIPEHPAYSVFPTAGPLPVVHRLRERLLGLPFHPALSEQDIERVCVMLAQILRSRS